MRNIERTNKTKICQFSDQIIVCQIEKKIQKIKKFYNFENHEISIIDKLKKNQISASIEYQKLVNF